MDLKNIKLSRNTVIILVGVIVVAAIVTVIPGVLISALLNLSYVAQIAFFVSATIWIWRHMK